MTAAELERSLCEKNDLRRTSGLPLYDVENELARFMRVKTRRLTPTSSVRTSSLIRGRGLTSRRPHPGQRHRLAMGGICGSGR